MNMNEQRMTMMEALKDPWNQWQVIARLLMNSLPQVSLPESGPIPSIPKWLARLSDEELKQADECCRQFCLDWKWPDVQGPLRYQLFFRAWCASEYAAIQGELRKPWPPDMVPWPQTMSFLLIEIWRKERLLWAANRHPSGDTAYQKPLLEAFDPAQVE